MQIQWLATDPPLSDGLFKSIPSSSFFREPCLRPWTSLSEAMKLQSFFQPSWLDYLFETNKTSERWSCISDWEIRLCSEQHEGQGPWLFPSNLCSFPWEKIHWSQFFHRFPDLADGLKFYQVDHWVIQHLNIPFVHMWVTWVITWCNLIFMWVMWVITCELPDVTSWTYPFITF
jgi:hypothetical protein